MSYLFRYCLLLLAILTVHKIRAEEEEPEEEPSDETTVAPETTTPLGHIADPCIKCQYLADNAVGAFANYTWFKVYERDNKRNPWVKAGKKNCEELAWAYQCFEHCTEELKPGAIYSYPIQYKKLQRMLSKYCEDSWGDGPGCRMADTMICETKYQKRVCGDNLKNYHQCVEQIIQNSSQDCTGICTPARRYHKVQNFIWDAECKLSQSVDGRCNDYVQLYCFQGMKDTDQNWGLFENMNTHEDYRNLDLFCPDAQDLITCLNETLTQTVTYFGFLYEKPCKSIKNNIIEIMDHWAKIIDPFCAGRPNGTKFVDEICGVAPTTIRIPSTTTAPPPSTTPLKTIRRKVVKRVKGSAHRSHSNQIFVILGIFYTVLLTFLSL